jgi:uncharacterized membrane protein
MPQTLPDCVIFKEESKPSMLSPSARLVLSRSLLALLFCSMGVLHLVVPGPFLRVMPPIFPYPYALVIISGIFEILGGMGVLIKRVRRLAGIGLISLLTAVYPVNIYMFQHQIQTHAWDLWSAVLLVRLPLQFAMIWWVYRSAILKQLDVLWEHPQVPGENG